MSSRSHKVQGWPWVILGFPKTRGAGLTIASSPTARQLVATINVGRKASNEATFFKRGKRAARNCFGDRVTPLRLLRMARQLTLRAITAPTASSSPFSDLVITRSIITQQFSRKGETLAREWKTDPRLRVRWLDRPQGWKARCKLACPMQKFCEAMLQPTPEFKGI